jgi:hypothetical protein
MSDLVWTLSYSSAATTTALPRAISPIDQYRYHTRKAKVLPRCSKVAASWVQFVKAALILSKWPGRKTEESRGWLMEPEVNPTNKASTIRSIGYGLEPFPDE